MSPIKEGETATDLKQQQLANLNNELTKINSNRRDSVEPIVDTEISGNLTVPNNNNKGVDGEKKERKISRFKVSVVTEPDVSKLEPQTDAVCVINDAYKTLERVVENCYAYKPGLFYCQIFFKKMGKPFLFFSFYRFSTGSSVFSENGKFCFFVWLFAVKHSY